MLAGLIFLGRGNSRVLADDGNTTDPNGNSAVTYKEDDGDSKEKDWHDYSKGYRNRFTQFKANSYDEVNVKQFTETHGGENAYMALKETGVVEEVIDAGVCPMVVLLVELANSKKGECFIVWPLFKYDIVQNEQKVTKWYKFNAEESNAAYVAYTEFLMERVKDEE